MKLHTVAFLTGCLAWPLSVGAVPEASPPPVEKAPETRQDKPVPELIAELADPQYRVREEASLQLWKAGFSALEELRKAAEGQDPEMAFRSRELIRKIELDIRPDTDPAVLKLVERYAKASANEKQGIFSQLTGHRAWRQLLKLYAGETDPEVQTRLQDRVDGIALIAARECLLEGNATGAREFLEMAPADATGLLALAEFHRTQGSLDAELARAKTLKGKQADAWQLALYRASGDLERARAAADAAGEGEISAAMSVLLGDPLPWLRRGLQLEDNGRIYLSYTDLAIRRWEGQPVRPQDLEPIERAAKSRSDGDRETGIGALFLLGETATAEAEMAKLSPSNAYTYYESQDRVPEALRMLGLDPEKPDYKAWVETRFEAINKADGEDEDASTETLELGNLANFMERHGLDKELDAAFREPLRALAADDEHKFLDLIGPYLQDTREAGGAPRLATRVLEEWAGNDPRRWDDVLASAFGSEEGVSSLWDWLPELDPKVTLPERLEVLLVFRGIGNDPNGLRGKWLDLLWQAIGKSPEDKRKPLLDKAVFMTGLSMDMEGNLKLWDLISKQEGAADYKDSRILYFTAGGRWNEAADYFLAQIELTVKSRQGIPLGLYACAAASLRHAGRLEEAAAHDAMVEKLSLSRNCREIANSYALCEDFAHAIRWQEKAVRMAQPGEGEFAIALEANGQNLLNDGRWREAGAAFEVIAQMYAGNNVYSSSSPVNRLNARVNADLGRALANLGKDRAGSIAILDACHRMFPSDGSLADYFFPSVRKAGLIKEHDAWFKISWERATAVVKRFPNSDNSLNTAGWLASRACRKLDEAEQFLERALEINPEQYAYLDTMAEIQFAKGKREKALEWSGKAINFFPGDDTLRRQREHFRNDPFPK